MRQAWIHVLLHLGNLCLLVWPNTSMVTESRYPFAHFTGPKPSAGDSNVPGLIDDTNEPQEKGTEVTEARIQIALNAKRPYFSVRDLHHRIVKRNASGTKPTTKTPPFIIPPPFVTLPSDPTSSCPREKSCSGRCTNKTEWRTETRMTCSCDPDCYEVFNDCCADYEKFCGAQKPKIVPTKKYKWTCEDVGHYSPDLCTIAQGIWMVSHCPENSPNDTLRTKCENPLNKLQSTSLDFSRYLPVVSRNITFRNLYCALCNKVTDKYEFWPVDIKSIFIPPESYNFNEKVKLLLSYGASFPVTKGPSFPKSTQPRRYCMKNIKTSCLSGNTSLSCSNGSTAIVSHIGGSFFKNTDCAICNGLSLQVLSCFPSIFLMACSGSPPQTFLLVLEYQKSKESKEDSSSFTVKSVNCDKGMIYDDKLQTCLPNQLHPPKQNDLDEFYVLSWVALQKNSKDTGFSPSDFHNFFVDYFNVLSAQIRDINVSSAVKPVTFIPRSGQVIAFHLVSLIITLTPQQSLELLKVNRYGYTSTSNPSLLNFIYFRQSVNVVIKNESYTIIKTASRPLSCVTRKHYTAKEYTVLEKGQVDIKRTKVTYQSKQYFPKGNLGNITVCEKDIPTCNKTGTILSHEQLIIMAGLRIHDRKTSIVYNYGQYDVLSNSTIELCISSDTKLNKTTDRIQHACDVKRSCAGRCTNWTEWRTETKFRCFCDPDCYEVFNDCCADYEEFCGLQTLTVVPTKKYKWTCKGVGHIDNPEEPCYIGEGTWMVSDCSEDWPNDHTRTKCEKPLSKPTVSSPDLSRYVPVIGPDNVTFRNVHCAICNRIDGKFKYWPVAMESSVIPPEHYNLTEKIRFLLSHGAKFSDTDGPPQPKSSQPRRYCVKQIENTCSKQLLSSACTNGPVAMVSSPAPVHYKNTHCAACNGFVLPSSHLFCFPANVVKSCGHFQPQSFSIVINYKRGVSSSEENSQLTVQEKDCSKQGKIYDNILQMCRINWLDPPEKNVQEHFYVNAWLAPKESSQDSGFSENDYQESVAEYFKVSPTQLLELNITSVHAQSSSFQFQSQHILFYLVSSRVILTPQQSLALLSGDWTGGNDASKPNLLNYVYFTEPFTLSIKNKQYTLFKTTSRPLACIGKTTYTPQEYILLGNDQVYINSTNTTYKKSQYMYRGNNLQYSAGFGNITVCKKYVRASCRRPWTILSPGQFTILVNLSIYNNKTNMLFHYGEYEVFANNSIGICVSADDSIITEARKTIRNNKVFGWITFFGFLLSIVFLTFLLITYMLFSQLRTLPGKNLMNLAATMLLFELWWIPPGFSSVRSNQSACRAVAIIEHYFLLASFASMSVIAFHTYKTFSRKLPAPKPSESQEKKLFILYLLVIWLIPAIFVVTCVILDGEDIVHSGYGESEICWTNNKEAYLYFEILPLALMLLFNIIAFIKTAVSLRKHAQNRAIVQTSGTRQTNLFIYIRLSTLMGFTWLFAFLALLTDISTPVFWYIFVILTCLQGVSVTVAFVVNKKTLRLYQKAWNKTHSRSSTPNTDSTAKKDTKLFEDTRL